MSLVSRWVRVVLFVAMLGTVGCVEWNKYWEKSPTRPEIEVDRTAPTVRIVSPSGPDSAQATPITGDAYMIVLEADDDVGVARVQLQLDDAIEQLTRLPWEIGWNTLLQDEGSIHRLIATAVDAAGNSSIPDTAYAQVFNSGPEVVIGQPLDGALVLGSITLEAAFVGETPPIESVEFLAGPLTVGRLEAPPWSLMLDTNSLAAGDHFVTARATTEFGAVGVSDAIRIRVNNGTPDLTVEFPEDGRRVASRGTLILSGDAVDQIEGPLGSGGITWRSNIDGDLGQGRYLRISGLTAGDHTIDIAATNAWGTTGSASITVHVVAEPTYSYCDDLRPALFVGQACTVCHSVNSPEYSVHRLDLESYAAMLEGGRTWRFPILTPGKPDSSLLWNKVFEQFPLTGDPMPPPSQYPSVPRAILEQLRTWILEGAPPDDPEICTP